MYTLEGITQEDIITIYQNTVDYSLKKYEEFPDILKEMYQIKYEHALSVKNELGIIEKQSKDELKAYLQETKNKVNNIQKNNQPIIDMLADEILNILKQEKPENLTNTEICEYIFDYVTNIMSYDTDWYNYCHLVPPIDGYDFNFHNGVPLSSSYKGLLITRQGICEDIANLMMLLGRVFNINIKALICKHGKNIHAINYIELENGEISLIDASSVILKGKTKQEAFLVSEQLLNKDDEYDFSDLDKDLSDKIISSTILQKNTPSYDIKSIIEKTNKLLPSINYTKLNNEKKELY